MTKESYIKERITNCIEQGFFHLVPYWEKKLKEAEVVCAPCFCGNIECGTDECQSTMDKVCELMGFNGFR